MESHQSYPIDLCVSPRPATGRKYDVRPRERDAGQSLGTLIPVAE